MILLLDKCIKSTLLLLAEMVLLTIFSELCGTVSPSVKILPLVMKVLLTGTIWTVDISSPPLNLITIFLLLKIHPHPVVVLVLLWIGSLSLHVDAQLELITGMIIIWTSVLVLIFQPLLANHVKL